jgi:hypothetical protein
VDKNSLTETHLEKPSSLPTIVSVFTSVVDFTGTLIDNIQAQPVVKMREMGVIDFELCDLVMDSGGILKMDRWGEKIQRFFARILQELLEAVLPGTVGADGAASSAGSRYLQPLNRGASTGAMRVHFEASKTSP